VSEGFDGWLAVLTFAAALGCGLNAGVFFAFSTFVMPALARLPAPHGIAAMQSINVAAITPSFMAALFGTGLACVILIGRSLTTWPSPGAVYVLPGCLLYLAGTVLVTIVFNVPRNDALAGVDAASAEGATLWASYLTSWTTWNHVRTASALGAAALLTLALCLPRPGAAP
jgi:uncharacterized membrane protein